MAALFACREPPSVEDSSDRTGDAIGDVAVIPLISDEFSIVKMATAHGTFTVELQVDRGTDMNSIA